MKKLYLASASPRRKELMEKIGYPFEVLVSEADETISETNPDRVTMALSERKAMAVAATLKDGIVIGADTVVSIDDRILGKPADAEEAFDMIDRLQGREHAVTTGYTIILISDGKITRKQSGFEETKVKVAPMLSEEIKAYISTGEPFDKAGGYGIQGQFAVYVEEIKGDYYNVVGLPICRLYHELKVLL